VAYNGETDRKALARDLEGAIRGNTVAALRGKPPIPVPAG
jgi:hypothetical protein